ncbi:AT-rich interactive domain-containing protein 4A isoform X1 [Heterocephalus glaber]|uniref:AT-rich interactive domain-containing protein 4A n=1 Tax=Heterocephalus glaber TaxID=10181 RepID=A0AAX6QCS6_HETGA|nr:AT-rich interactive domain-containing protein 4A isoform X1 [Heterocephalus glaber]XP_004871162.1 AT-rich interactive domain-containing protein 4A isoform X1 [Heterocephalus glaber]XP_021104874.1 AT-rich interactive domain-containing protein 4A isoform X1 [Heterocephalus glaber]XP_021104875.1 AT-rich interactive domain-containing protein 4A isoform X1 [Heterocephalus glaber]
MKAADEPAYLTVGTDVSAKYRGAFCEAKIKTVKRLVKVKVLLKQDNTTQLVQDDQIKGPLRVGAIVETRAPDGSFQEAVISKLTDASWYTVVFDDGDERTLRRTSLCLKGERHFAESETLDQLPLTNPEHFGTPVIAKKTNRGRRSSLPVNEDEKEEESSEEEDEDKQRLNDELLGKIVRVVSTPERPEWYPALVVSPSCNDDITVKKDQCLVRSFIDSKFYAIARKDIKEVDILNLPESELSAKPELQKASIFLKARVVPDNWKMDLSEILESSSSDDEDGPAEENDEEKEKETKKEEEEVPEEELDPEERDNFLQQLYKFMEDRGTPINKPPVLGYKDLNLFKLFRLVYHQGGCDNIDSGAVWKQIYMDLGIPILNSAASYNVKTAYRKYLYGFEEYCRSANIQFRTIHHHEPKVKVEKKDLDESMEEALKVDQEMPLIEVKSELEETTDSNSESEREELELKSPRGRRRIARDANSIKKEIEEEKTEDKLRDNDSENKDVDDDYETAEKEENGLILGRKNTPKPKEKKVKKQEGSDRDSEGEEEKNQEREETESKCDSEGEEDEEDTEPCLTGTKVKVKYGRGKTQKIYEASIKSTEIDDGEVLYLVHYYGWNVRYDEWVKADRIIWPLDKGGPKKKQKKKAKNKEDSEKDEKREEDRQRTKRGRPPLRSSLPSGVPFGLPTAVHSEGKSDSCSSDSETEDPLEKSLINEELFPDNKEELEKNENLNDDKLDEENPKIAGHMVKENDRVAVQPLETLQLEVGENEQIVQLFGNKMEQGEEVKKEAEKSPKGKGRRSKTKDISLEIIKISSFSQGDTGSEPHVEAHSLEFSSLDSKNFSSAAGDEIDQYGKERKLKRKILGHSSPEKKLRMENGMGMTNSVSQERTSDCIGSEGMKSLRLEQHFEPENEGMPSLTAEAGQCRQELACEELEHHTKETASTPLKEEDAMPLIGPETLVCHEVDLDDLDDKDKPGTEDMAVQSSEVSSLVSVPHALLPTSQHDLAAASPLGLSQDESRSVRSESDATVEVDSTTEESPEGPSERERPVASSFEASSGPAACSLSAQERESREKGHKRPSDGNGGLMAKKQKRTPKRTSAAAKREKNGAGQSSDSEDLPAVNNSSKCTPVKHLSVSKPPKLARSPARISPHIKDGEKEKQREKHPNSSPRTYKWTLQLNELDNMNSTERISFLQEKLQEIRKYYMSLKSEVATIDRRRKRLKKKDREVSHVGASMSSASSDTGMSPSSSSPPQNVLAVECR